MSLVVLGAGLVVGAIALAGVMLAFASSTYSDGVERLARAPIGCTTTMQFDRSGTFVVYVETEGATAKVSGDCPSSGATFRHVGDLPKVDIEVRGKDDTAIAISDGSSGSYDADGHVGRAIGTVTVPAAGGYRLTASSESKDIAVAVGKDPTTQPKLLRAVGILGGLVLLIVGAILIVMGLRRPAAPAGPAGTGSSLDLDPFVPITSTPPGGGWAPPPSR